MKKITIKFPDNTSIQVENEICPLTLMKHFGDNGQKIMAVKMNNVIQEAETSIALLQAQYPKSWLTFAR